MKTFIKVLFFFVFAFFLVSEAVAQEYPAKFPPLSWTQEMVDQATQTAREQLLPQAQRADGSFMGQETPQERAAPIVDAEIDILVVHHAIFWTTVYWCGLPLTNAHFEQFQDSSYLSEKQQLYISALHGLVSTFNTEELGRREPCTDEFKQYLAATFPVINQ